MRRRREREQDALRKELEAVDRRARSQLGVAAKAIEGTAGEDRKATRSRNRPPTTRPIQGNRSTEEMDCATRRRTPQEQRATRSIPRTRTPQGTLELAQVPPTADERTLAGMNFGRYYAIVIGNQDYQSIEDLADAALRRRTSDTHSRRQVRLHRANARRRERRLDAEGDQ